MTFGPKSKNGTLSDSQIAESVLLNNADFNRERTNKRNAPNNADFNEARLPEFGQEKQLSFEKSDGGTKSIKSWKTDLTIPRIYESEF